MIDERSPSESFESRAFASGPARSNDSCTTATAAIIANRDRRSGSDRSSWTAWRCAQARSTGRSAATPVRMFWGARHSARKASVVMRSASAVPMIRRARL